MYEDDPQDRVFEEIGRAVFDGHPLARPVIGTAEAVGSVSRDQLSAYHAARYTPDAIVIAAAGSVDHEALVEMARAAGPQGGGSGAAEHDADLDAAVRATPRFSPRRLFLRKDTEQFHVCVGGAGHRAR